MNRRLISVVSALTIATASLVSAAASADAADYTSPFALNVDTTNTWNYRYEQVGGGPNLCSMYTQSNGGFDSDPSHYYSTYYMYVPVAGDYAYADVSSGDMVTAVYALDSFDPTAPTSNCVAAGDDSSDPDWSLSVGWYTLVVSTYNAGDSGPVSFTLTGPGNVVVSDTAPPSATSTRDLTIWQQATARKADGVCDPGWRPSWMEWVNNGTGGFVCVRTVYAYYPNETVPD